MIVVSVPYWGVNAYTVPLGDTVTTPSASPSAIASLSSYLRASGRFASPTHSRPAEASRTAKVVPPCTILEPSGTVIEPPSFMPETSTEDTE